MCVSRVKISFVFQKVFGIVEWLGEREHNTSPKKKTHFFPALLFLFVLGTEAIPEVYITHSYHEPSHTSYTHHAEIVFNQGLAYCFVDSPIKV